MISSLCLSMIFSENRFPLFRIMLWGRSGLESEPPVILSLERERFPKIGNRSALTLLFGVESCAKKLAGPHQDRIVHCGLLTTP